MSLNEVKKFLDDRKKNSNVIDEDFSFKTISSVKYPEKAFVIKGKSVKEFSKILKQLYSKLNIKKFRLGFKMFENIIIESYFDNKLIPKNIIDRVNKIKDFEAHYLHKIYGVDIPGDLVKYSNFTLIKKEFLEKYIDSFSSNLHKLDLKTFSSQDNYIIIDIIVKSKDTEFGYEKSKIHLNEIINIFYFLASNKLFESRYYIGVVPPIQYKNSTLIFASNKRSTSGFNIQIKDLKITLENPDKNSKIYKIISGNNLNELEKRIRIAMIWIGISLQENNETISFVEAFFALESLLKYDDDLISKSITASLSETVALLVGETYDERIKLEKKIKVLYRERSKIVHSGIFNDDINYYEFISIIYKCIFKLIENEPFSKMNNINDLRKHIDILRYS